MTSVNEIINLILKPGYKNSLIIGDNTSGKTYILEQLIKAQKGNNYYISVNNRNVELQSMNFREPISEHLDVKKLALKRVDPDTPNEDLWYGKSSDRFASDVFAKTFSEDNNKEVIEKFFGSTIEINKVDEENGSLGGLISRYAKNKVTFKDNITDEKTEHLTLSNGLSSIFRILLELQLASKEGCDAVLIDEIEKYLDSSNSFKLIQFIQEHYSQMKLIITTHSEDIIVGSSGFNILKINNDSNDVNEKSIEIYDGNDFDSIVSTKKFFFPVANNIEFLDVFRSVDKIYNKLLMSEDLSNEEQKSLNILSTQKDLPSKVLNIIYEINKLRNR